MKLIIQIPCWNEEKTIGTTLSDLPRELPGIDAVEWLIVDDGCTDRTVEVARSFGVDHVVRLPRNQGLARAFIAGVEACLEAGADIILNTDADNQYRADDIPKLIQPIIDGKADMVIGSRPIDEIKDFSRVKKFLQKLGSWVVRLASKTKIPDGPSGFRAMSKNVAMSINVFDSYTYTIETIIQAGVKGWAIAFIPIRTNKTERPSRLIKNIPQYIFRSANTIIRIFMLYKPFRFFAIPGTVALFLGVLIGFRFLLYYIFGTGAGHIQSLILTAILISGGCLLIVAGLVTDLISVNRRLLEKIDWRSKKIAEYLRNSKAEK